ncbi:MAG TPA: hypothetical protein VGV38_15195, partial [Pyrinomonadaceae bacterium]|nr:hypothetical protein [Pyrinomonadaceae bacterium]
MKKLTALVLFLSAASLCAPAQDSAPGPLTRVVKDGVVISKEQPSVRVRVDKAFNYVGGQSFVLYGVANAEQHFFVDADKDGRIRRLYWLQFEGYLPSNTHTYNYQSPRKVNVGGLEFISDSQARNITATPPRPDSDGARAHQFLRGKGYRIQGGDVLWQRLVHLTDASKRNELMVIYLEDLGGTGLTAAD